MYIQSTVVDVGSGGSTSTFLIIEFKFLLTHSVFRGHGATLR